MKKLKKGMSELEFLLWKRDWLNRVPKCKDFACCHELMSCAINPLCGCGSIYATYLNQDNPQECIKVNCSDCLLKYDCTSEMKNKTLKEFLEI